MNTKFHIQLFSTLLFSLSLCALINAQNQKYDLESSIETYVPLDNGVVLTNEEDGWADFGFAFETTFEFSVDLLGIEITSLFNLFSPSILTPVDIGQGDPFAAGATPYIFVNSAQFENRALVDGNSPSLIRSLTEGEIGKQIFKLEFYNVGLEREISELGTANMIANQQLWIYEETGCIEYRFGSNSITDSDLIFDGETGPLFGFIKTTLEEIFAENTSYEYAIFAGGDSSNPVTFEQENDSIPPPFLNNYPEDGMVYTFCPEVENGVRTKDISSELDWIIYPNPVESTLTLDFKDATKGQYKIISMDGKLISEGSVASGKTLINLNNLTTGHYIAKVITKEGFAVKRFFKANTAK